MRRYEIKRQQPYGNYPDPPDLRSQRTHQQKTMCKPAPQPVEPWKSNCPRWIRGLGHLPSHRLQYYPPTDSSDVSMNLRSFPYRNVSSNSHYLSRIRAARPAVTSPKIATASSDWFSTVTSPAIATTASRTFPSAVADPQLRPPFRPDRLLLIRHYSELRQRILCELPNCLALQVGI